MLGAQEIKGKEYRELRKVYTVVILGNTLFMDREYFYDEYRYRNKEGRELQGNTQIIFIELSKLEKILIKPVSSMTGLEKWSIFLRYANHTEKKQILAQIMESEEGVRMGAEALESISSNRDKFITYFHRLKFEADQESQLIYARRLGEEAGIEKGEKKGRLEGEKIGIRKGENNILELMRKGYTADEIEKLLTAQSETEGEDPQPATASI